MYREFALYLTEAFLFMNAYGWIPNSYVAEYFVYEHWRKLPASWQRCLENVSLKEIASNMLQYVENKKYSSVWPLSLLSFVSTCHALSLNRTQRKLYASEEPKELSNVFRKHIKPKKRHELSILPEVIHDVCERTGTRHIVDVGSGLGHLARFLAYKYGYDVTAVEMATQSKPVAEKFDKDMEQELQRLMKDSNGKRMGKVNHITQKIEADITSQEFSTLVGGDEDTKYLLIGLHTCGDLASTMLKVFKSTPAISAVVSVSCCYFKMTLKGDVEDDGGSRTSDMLKSLSLTGGEKSENIARLYGDFRLGSLYKLIEQNTNINPISVPNGNLTSGFGIPHEETNQGLREKKQKNEDTEHGFPLSQFLQRIPYQPLKYKSFETACHFIDDYTDKLLSNSPKLKLHCYRAIMEVIMRKLDPDLVLASVRCKKIKNAGDMTFSEYASKVLERVGIAYQDEILELVDFEGMLEQWKSVCFYHSIGHLMGSVVESIALVDKCMFLLESRHRGENGFSVSLEPLFDPKISPRNFVVIATRN